MTLTRRQATIGGATLLAGTSMGTLAQAQRDRPLKRAVEDVEEQEKVRRAERLTPKELANRTVFRRAVDAVIWGLPLVGEDSVKQAAFRDGKANYNDIVWWPKGVAGRTGRLRPTSTRAICISSSTPGRTGQSW
jgi:hypothetical protein